MQYLQLSPAWRLEQKGAELYITGGQDAVFTLDLDPAVSSFFGTLQPGKRFTASQLSPADQLILEQLLSAGVIVPLLVTTADRPITLRTVSSIPVTLQLTNSKQTTTQTSDFLLLVRTHESLSDFINTYDYLKITQPHLLLDLAYEHTISLGPLEFPGLTACVACLKGRLESRWGDDPPPPEPHSTTQLLSLAEAWVSVELNNLFAAQDYFLVNKPLVMDIQSRSITANTLLTVPLCPYCRKTNLPLSGKLRYTFGKA